MEVAEEKIRELEDKYTEILQSKCHSEKNASKKMKRVADTYGTIAKVLLFMSSGSQKEKECRAGNYLTK